MELQGIFILSDLSRIIEDCILSMQKQAKTNKTKQKHPQLRRGYLLRNLFVFILTSQFLKVGVQTLSKYKTHKDKNSLVLLKILGASLPLFNWLISVCTPLQQ